MANYLKDLLKSKHDKFLYISEKFNLLKTKKHDRQQFRKYVGHDN
jgi:hypothetical protein